VFIQPSQIQALGAERQTDLRGERPSGASAAGGARRFDGLRGWDGSRARGPASRPRRAVGWFLVGVGLRLAVPTECAQFGASGPAR
jgi:hypothetical protein